MRTEWIRSGTSLILGEKATKELRRCYWWLLARVGPITPIGRSQNDESEIIDELLALVSLPPTFCEFGFHIKEFNCALLVSRGWQGLLIDGDKANVEIAQGTLKRSGHDGRVSVVNAFLTTDNVAAIVSQPFEGRELGILSVDIDGNDYWILRQLLPMRPCLIIVEYNASLGLRSLSTPYDPRFDRHEKHASGWYHGASITALNNLCTPHGYSLVRVCSEGLNLFFLRNDLLDSRTTVLSPSEGYRENQPRNRRSRSSAEEQWNSISFLPYVEL